MHPIHHASRLGIVSLLGLRRAPLVRGLVCLLVSSLTVPGQVLAHADSVGTPVKPSGEIRNGVVFDTGGYPANFDDGPDGDAEFLLSSAWFHAGHGFDVDQKLVYADTESTAQIKFEEYYTHPECTPAGEIIVVASLIEVNVEKSDTAVFNAVRLGITVALSATGVGAPIAASVNATMRAASMLMATNKAEDFGVVSQVVPPNGTTVLKFRGKSGGADLNLIGKEYPTQEVTCATTTPWAGYQLTPAERAEIFDETRERLGLISGIVPEYGNPAGLSEQDMLDFHASFESMFVASTRLIAGYEIERAAGFVGNDEAVALFAEAGAIAEQGDRPAAIELYGLAFAAAARAIEDDELGATRTIEPELVPYTSVLTSGEGHSFELPVFFLGLGESGTIDQLDIQGLPETATWKAVTLDGTSMGSILVELGETGAGDYELTLNAIVSVDGEPVALEAPFRLAVASASGE